jgi:DNA-directed RNA polymerase specialized sigma subunit
MSSIPSYARNRELFAEFYNLQSDFAACLSRHPGLVRGWLDALPPRKPEAIETAGKARSWRTVSLSSARRRELLALIAQAETPRLDASSLAGWLLAAVPVRTFFDIAASARPSLDAMDPAAEECHCRLVRLRETLFLTNYGLAKAAARRLYRQDYGDMLSAASCGLLDAIDRYVPGTKAARFGHFAGYWIRYHLVRQSQKNGSLVSFPVNQHRIRRRIDRYLAGRRANELPPPSPAELCADLKLGRAAFYWQQQRPCVVSLHAPSGPEPEAIAMENCLCDPAPEPDAVLERAEIEDRLRHLLQANAEPATRVMLAYTRSVGSLADAAEDYLAALHETCMARLSPRGVIPAGAAPNGIRFASFAPPPR